MKIVAACSELDYVKFNDESFMSYFCAVDSDVLMLFNEKAIIHIDNLIILNPKDLEDEIKGFGNNTSISLISELLKIIDAVFENSHLAGIHLKLESGIKIEFYMGELGVYFEDIHTMTYFTHKILEYYWFDAEYTFNKVVGFKSLCSIEPPCCISKWVDDDSFEF